MAARNPQIIRASSQGHTKMYIEKNGGEGTDIAQGGPTCLVTTVGNKGSRERTSPVNYMQDGDIVYIVGSIAGLDHHPHWVLNLDADSRSWIQVHEKKWETKARKIVGEERGKLWPRLVDHFPLWGHFQKYCEREFAVFEMNPA